MTTIRKNVLLIVLIVFSFIVGGLAQRIWHWKACDHRWDFLNETSVCDDLVISKHGYVFLKDSLVRYLDAKKDAGIIKTASVYFRDLKNGPVMGINESELYIAASLLKLPIAMAVYREAEENPSILEKKERYTKNDESRLDQVFVPKEKLELGREYTLGELVEHMIRHSDNVARNLVVACLNKITHDNSAILTTLRDLGLILPTSNEDETISVRSYSSLFRLLYNASYLNEYHSNHLLSIMTTSSFDQGLAKGVPSGTNVAHKFGERWNDKVKQVHDCGVIYFPDNPYLLCVMTEGKDVHEMTSVIADVSRMVYSEVESRRTSIISPH